MKIIRSTEYRKMPWKNGLGVTWEIARYPEGEGPYLWRLSQAEINADGPFSSFPGFDRWLTVMGENPVLLNQQLLYPLVPYLFSGDDLVHCKLQGSEVRDLGLIFDRTHVSAKMSLVEGRELLSGHGPHFFFDIESGDTWKREGPGEFQATQGILVTLKIL